MRLLIPALLLALAGCGHKDDPKPNPSASTTTAAVVPEPKPAAITVEEVSGDKLAAAIEKHKDKVVVVDFWAIWCTNCVKKFPHFVELQKKYGDKGLVCVSVAMDKLTPDSYKQEKVLSFLKERDATFPNYILAEPVKDDPVLEKKIGDGYRIIPYMLIFDKAGRKAWSSDDDGPPLTDAQLDKKLEELLSK